MYFSKFKFLLIVLCLFCATGMYAQHGCTFTKNVVNESTGYVEKTTSVRTIISRSSKKRAESLYFNLTRRNKKNYLEFLYYKKFFKGEDEDFCLSNGCEINIILKNDKLIILPYVGENDCAQVKNTQSKGKKLKTCTIGGSFLVSEKERKLLLKSRVLEIRIYFDELFVDFEVPPASVDKPDLDYLHSKVFLEDPQNFFISQLPCLR